MSHSNNPTRRLILAGTGAVGAMVATPLMAGQENDGFVRRDGQRFVLNGQTYRYVGANMWYGAYLGADAAYGNKPRLKRELDSLQALGISNLRLLASSELSPLNNSLDPAVTEKGKPYNEVLLKGMDHILAEMATRNMKGVLYLTNFWEWSGGMMAYQYYTTGQFINNGDPAYPWPLYADRSAMFYKNKEAMKMYYAYVKAVVGRVNSITGVAYKDDPTIMSWQLSNEPRPTGAPENYAEMRQPYLDWIKATAALIRSIDNRHMVSLGHEGLMGCVGRSDCVYDAHNYIDYVTAHIWPQNWSWVDAKDLKGTVAAGEEKVKAYIEAHIEMARLMNKPLVIEEFGFPRDEALFESGTSTYWRDRFYNLIYSAVETAMKTGGPMSGSNFWAWGGEGRATHEDYHLRRGETAYVGDPPHEPQGWYSVFDNDISTQALIKAHALGLRLGS